MTSLLSTVVRVALATAVLLTASPSVAMAQGRGAGPAQPEPGPIRRLPDGTPDISGLYQANAGGANYGLERQTGPRTMWPPSRGVVVDPPDGRLPLQPWARQEATDRQQPARGYDDPTAHCLPGGIPRSHYVPSPFHILQTPGSIVVLYERMSWRSIPLDGRAHVPDDIRLWMGDSVGRWEGDTLVVETTNFNGKTWLNEWGDIITHDLKVVERFTPVNADTITYQATLTDPLAYTRPFTIEMPFNRMDGELLEVACHEDNQDLQHMRDVKEGL